MIYCKFWDLDQDHDMIVNYESLQGYDRGTMSPSILQRVIDGCGKPYKKDGEARMTYEEFIWFILSVEDKETVQAIEYWFRCVDIDGDGVISLFEINHFYEDQYDRMMLSRGSDLWKLGDYICHL